MRLPVSAALVAAMFGVAGAGIDLATAPTQTAVPLRVTFGDDLAHKITSDLRGTGDGHPARRRVSVSRTAANALGAAW